MRYCNIKTVTATLPVAVVFVALLVSGCATKRDIDEINTSLARVERNSSQSQKMVARMDSTIAAGADASRRLQNDIRLSTDELGQQLSQLLENFNDLIARVDQLSRQQVIKLPPTSSPGSQRDPNRGSRASGTPSSQQRSQDCVDAYDGAFVLTLAGDYQPAIAAFEKFLTNCRDDFNAANAHYWIGDCYYNQKKFSQAVESLELLLKNYPDTPTIQRTLHTLARCKEEQGKKDEARALYERIVKDHAGSFEAEQAAQRLKDL